MVEKIAEYCKTGLYLRRAVKSEKQETNFSFLFYFVIWKKDMEQNSIQKYESRGFSL